METGHSVAKETIRTVATNLFACKGFAATSTREICEKAGVTKPVLYYHFENKGQLYRELILDASNEYLKELERAAARKGTARERCEGVISTVFAFCRQHPDLMRLGFRIIFAPENNSAWLNILEVAEADEHLMASIVQSARDSGELNRDPLEIANALVGITRFYVMSHLVTGEPFLDSKLARGIVDIVMSGCQAHTDR